MRCKRAPSTWVSATAEHCMENRVWSSEERKKLGPDILRKTWILKKISRILFALVILVCSAKTILTWTHADMMGVVRPH